MNLFARFVPMIEDPGISPNFAGLPGVSVITGLLGNFGALALMVLVGVVMAGGVAWGFGSLSSNPGASSMGKNAVLWGLGGAFIVGMASMIVTFFANAGGSI